MKSMSEKELAILISLGTFDVHAWMQKPQQLSVKKLTNLSLLYQLRTLVFKSMGANEGLVYEATGSAYYMQDTFFDLINKRIETLVRRIAKGKGNACL